eukprot:362094_1
MHPHPPPYLSYIFVPNQIVRTHSNWKQWQTQTDTSHILQSLARYTCVALQTIQFAMICVVSSVGSLIRNPSNAGGAGGALSFFFRLLLLSNIASNLRFLCCEMSDRCLSIDS